MSNDTFDKTLTPFAQANITAARAEGLEPNLKRQLRFLGLTGPIELQLLKMRERIAGIAGSANAFAATVEDAVRLAHESEGMTGEGCYLIMNRHDPRCAARQAANTWTQLREGSATSDRDIVSREAFYVDCDVVRPRGISATNDEAKQSVAVGRQVRDLLAQHLGGDECLGWGMSGNGCQIYCALDSVPNTEEVQSLIARILAGLQQRFGVPDRIKIDDSVVDAKRLAPAFGTRKCKGEHTEERPHRRTFFVCYDEVKRLSVEQLRALADAIGCEPKQKQSRVQRSAAGPTTPSAAAQYNGSPAWRGAMLAEARAAAAKLGLDPERPGCLDPRCRAADAAWFRTRAGYDVIKCHHASCGGFACNAIDMVALLAFDCADVKGTKGMMSRVRQWFADELGLDCAPRKQREAQPASERYGVVDGRICRLGELPVPLCNFDARIAGEVTIDDGLSHRPSFLIAGCDEHSQRLPLLEVPSADYDGLEWLSQWGSRVYIEPGRSVKEHLRVAIKQLSEPERATQYLHTGWREIDGEQVYLMPRGTVGGDESISCKIGVSGYGFGGDDLDLVECVRKSCAILECGDSKVVAPLLAAAYCAPLRPSMPLAFTIALLGRTQLGKTGLAAAISSHFGDFTWDRLPVSADATAAALECVKYELKDTLLVIDNVVPGVTAAEQRKASATLQRSLTSTGDGSTRRAMARSGDAFELRGERPSRCLTLLTAEDLPENLTQSALGRTLVVEVQAGQIDIAKLAAMNGSAPALQRAMRGYIEMLSPFIGDADFSAELAEERARYAAGCRETWPGASERQINNIATLMVGMWYWTCWAQQIGAITAARGDVMRVGLARALVRSHDTQAEHHNAVRSPAHRWLEAVESLVRGGQAYICPSPDVPLLSTPGCPAIGWMSLDQTTFYLDAALAWKAGVDMLGGPDRFGFSRRQTFKQLVEDGLALRDTGTDRRSAGRNTQRRRCGGAQVDVLVVPRSSMPSLVPEQPTEPDEHGNVALEGPDLN